MLERIVLTCNYSPWSRYSGGGQRSTHALGSAFAAMGYEVDVVFTKAITESFSVPESLPYRLRWATFAGLRSDGKNPLRALNTVSVLRTVRRLIGDSIRPTAIHAQGDEGALLHRLTSPTTCFVQTPRDSSLHDPIAKRTAGRIWIRPKFIALRHALRHAAAVCPTSASSAEQICRSFQIARERMTVVPNGIDNAFMRVVREETSNDAPLVYVGRLSSSKGVHELIDVWSALNERPRLLIVGTGPEEDAMRRHTQQAGLADRATFAGWCTPEQTAEHMAHARAVVLPTYEESFGNTVVEAMASGAPLVTTQLGSLLEVVGDPEYVWWCQPANRGSLAKALRDCLDQPQIAERKARAAQDFARRTYSWGATAQRYVQVYQRALA